MVGGTGRVGGQEKEWMGCLLDGLRAFGINADHWTTAAIIIIMPESVNVFDMTGKNILWR